MQLIRPSAWTKENGGETISDAVYDRIERSNLSRQPMTFTVTADTNERAMDFLQLFEMGGCRLSVELPAT